MTMAEGNNVRVILDILGARNIAMFLGVVCGWLLAADACRRWLVAWLAARLHKQPDLPQDYASSRMYHKITHPGVRSREKRSVNACGCEILRNVRAAA